MGLSGVFPCPLNNERTAKSHIQRLRGGEKWKTMNECKDWPIIATYSLQQVLADGLLVPVFDEYTTKRLAAFTGGRQIVATAHLSGKLGRWVLVDIWNKFALWKQDVEPALPEEERLFHLQVQGKTVWVVEDGAAFTLMYPEDY